MEINMEVCRPRGLIRGLAGDNYHSLPWGAGAEGQPKP